MDVFENLQRLIAIKAIVAVLLAYLIFKLLRLYWFVQKNYDIFGAMPSPPRHWFYGNMHLLPEGPSENRLKMALEFVNKYKYFYVWWNTPLKASINVFYPDTLSEGPSENRLKMALEFVNKHKYFYVWWNTPLKASINVFHPDTVRAVMKTSEPKPTGLFGIYRLALPWLGEGLLIASGERWNRSRRLLTPAFHFEILKPYIDVYNDATDIFIDNLKTLADSGEKFEVFTHVSKVTLDIILRCAFSYHTNVQSKEGASHPYIRAVADIAESWVFRARRLWLYPDWIFYLTPRGQLFRKQCNFVHRQAEEIIEKRQKTLEEHGKSERKYLDFLDILLTAEDENGVGLTPIEIRNEVDTFLFEGHDTTASAISWILYSLAKHPEHQKKCQEEVDEILQGRDSDNIEWDDISKMEYLTMCIKEGMRDHCPVPFIQREFTHSFEMDGNKFPAGTTVSLHIYGLHHNKNVWDKPMEYIPERFSKDNCAKMDPFQFVPFSAGPRNCIGQHFAMNEEKVVLAKLLRNFSFELDPSHEVTKKVAAVMRADDGMLMFVKRR